MSVLNSILKSYLERKLYLDMLENSRLQIMRLGDPNIRHFEDSDLQILGFRCSKTDMSRDWRPNRMLNKRSVFPWAEDCFSTKQHFPQTAASTCYTLSRHKVFKLAGNFIPLLERLAVSCNKATPWTVSMVWGGGEVSEMRLNQLCQDC